MRAAIIFVKKLLDSIQVLIITLLRYVKNVLLGRIGKVDDNKKHDEIVIMGNGPSLNDVNFSKINRQHYKFCCVNDYPLKNENFFRLKPEYLCMTDPAYYDFTIKAEKENYRKLFQNLERVDWKLKIIAPNGQKLNIKNPNVSYAWINTNVISKDIYLTEKWSLYNRNLANPGRQNVVLSALYYSLMTNHKKIYVCGVDFSDFKSIYVDEDNRIYVDSTHSYGTTRYYFDEMPEYGFTEFHTLLEAYRRMFLQASKVREYADYKGIEIINLSLQSYIDSFRKDNPSILEE